MTNHESHELTTDYSDSVDAELLDAMRAIQQQLVDGVEPDLEKYVDQLPHHADAIRRYVQTMRAIVTLGMDETSADGASATGTKRKNIGEFTIVREIGRGGMGVVYEAIQESLDRRVALKVLPFAGIADNRQLQRFRNEARAAATLHHRHIVPVHSVGSDKGIHYFAMQLIEGPSLADVIRSLHQDTLLDSQSQRLPDQKSAQHSTRDDTLRVIQAAISTLRGTSKDDYFRQAVAWIAQAADGLAHAHQHGVLHRDVKPGNLLIDENSSVWITDFGLARLESDASITATGDLLGTLRYMAPEQASGKGELVDQRADVFGLGLTLFELLTLQPGYAGDSRDELLKQVSQQDIAPTRKLDISIPADLETIVIKATARIPDERYRTATDLRDDLRAFLDDRPIAAKRPSLVNRTWKWASRHQRLVTTGALSLVIAAVSIGAIQHRANRQIRESLSIVEAKNLELELAKQEANDALDMATDAVSKFYRRYRSKVLGRLNEIPELKEEYDWFYAESSDYFRRLAETRPNDVAIQAEAAMAIYQYGMAYSESPTSASAQESLKEAYALVQDLDPKLIPTEDLRGYIQTLALYSSYVATEDKERDQLLHSIQHSTRVFETRIAGTKDDSKLRDLGFIQGNLRAMHLGCGDVARSRIWASASVRSFGRALEIAPDDELIRTYLADAILKEGDFEMPCRKRAVSVLAPLFQQPILEHPQGDFPDRFMQLVSVLANPVTNKQKSLALWKRGFEYAKRHDRGLPAYRVFRGYKKILLMQDQLALAREANNHQRQFVAQQPNRFRSEETRLEAIRDCVQFDALLLTLEENFDDAIALLVDSPLGSATPGGETGTWNQVAATWSMPRTIGSLLSSPATQFDSTRMRWRIRDAMLEFANNDSDAFNLWALYAYGEPDISDNAKETLREWSATILKDWSQHQHLAAWGILGPAILVDSQLDETSSQLSESLVGFIEAEMPETQIKREWHSVVGWAYLRLGRYEPAKAAFLEADNLGRYSSFDRHFGLINNKLGLAIIHARLGDERNAQAAFAAAVASELSPGHFLARDTLRLMNEAAKLTDSQETLTEFLTEKSFAQDIRSP